MSKTRKKEVPAVNGRVKTDGHGSTFSRAKAIARGGLNTASQYEKYLDAANMDYVLDMPTPDPRIVYSGVGKRIALANTMLRAAAVFGGKNAPKRFFLSA